MALTNPKKLNMHLKAGMPDGYLVAAEDIKDETRDQNLQTSLDELYNAKGNGDGISEETDPVFTASPAHSITNDDIAAWNAKSDFSGSYNDLEDKPTIPSIDGLATEIYVTNAIANAQLGGNDNAPDLSGYATKDDLKSKVDKVDGKGLSTNDLTNELVKKINDAILNESDPIFAASPASNITTGDIESWNSKSEFSGSYNDLLDKPSIPSIDGLISKDEADTTYQVKGNYLTEHQDLSSYAKKSDVPSIEGLLSSTEAAQTYQPKGSYLTEHQSLSAYLKSSDAAKTYQPKGNYLTEHQSLADYALKSEIPSTAGLLSETKAASTYQPKGNYLTEHQSLEGYAKKTDIPSLDGLLSETIADATYQPKGDYLTEHQSLEAYLKSADAAKTYQAKGNYALSSDIPSLTGYATEDFVTSQGYLKEHQSLSGYATEDYVTSAINNAKLEGGDNDIDLSTYATKSWVEQQSYLTEHQDLSSYAKKTDVPSISGLATEEFVTSQGYLTEHQSLEAYAKKSEVPSITGLLSETKAAQTYQPKGTYLTEHQSLEAYAKKTEIPSLDGYATENFVTSQGYLTEHQSLEAYAKKSEVPSISGLLSETKAAQTYQPIGDYLTEHQSLADYAKKSEVPSISGLLSETKAAQIYQPKGDYLTEHQSLSAYLKSSDAETIYQPKGSYLTEHQSLADYLKSADAAKTYQPKGNYLTEHQSLVDYAKKSEVPSVDGLLSETKAAQTYQPKGSYLTEHQSLAAYLKSTDAATLYQPIGDYLTEHQSLVDYALKSEVPSIDGLLSETSAAQTYQPKGNYLTEHQSLVDYAKKTDIPSTTGLLSETKAATLYQPKGSYLTEHQSLDGYATEEFVTSQGYLKEHQSLTDYLKSADAAKTYQPKGSYLTSYTETDPVFKASAAYGIKSSDIAAWNNKSDFSGSYNDLEDKPTIPSISGLAKSSEVTAAITTANNYTDTAISNLVSTAPETLDTLNELAAALGNDANFSTTITTELGKKANTSDLATVATSGSYTDLSNKPTIPSIDGLISKTDADKAYQPKGTYLTSYTETDPVFKASPAYGIKSTDIASWNAKSDFSGSYNDLEDKPTIPSISGLLSETKAAQTYQPKGNYLTEHQSLVDYAKKTDLPSLTGYATESFVTSQGYLTEHQSLVDYALKSEVPSISGLLSETKAAQTYQPKGNYLTEHQSLSAYLKSSDAAKTYQPIGDYLTEHQSLVDYAKKTDIPSLTGYATESFVTSQGYLKEHQSLADYLKSTDAAKTYQPKGDYLTAETDPVFKASAAYGIKSTDIASWNAKSDFSGSYNDLEDKPTIPSISGLLSETKAAQTYQPKGSYLTEHQSLEGYATESWVEGKGYLTEHQSLANYALKSEVPSITGLLSETKAASTYQPKGTYLTTESDPVFTASPASSITEDMVTWITTAMADVLTTDDLDEICI